MDALHFEADHFFGPCLDPDCQGGTLAARDRRLEFAWPTREQQRLIADTNP